AVRGERALHDRDRIARPVAETDIGEPGALLQIDTQDQMIALRERALESPHHRPRGAGDAEAERDERPAEDAVHLVAPAAAAAVDDLVVDRRPLDGHGPAELDVEILVRNREQMGAVDLAQAFERRRRAPVETDA